MGWGPELGGGGQNKMIIVGVVFSPLEVEFDITSVCVSSEEERGEICKFPKKANKWRDVPVWEPLWVWRHRLHPPVYSLMGAFRLEVCTRFFNHSSIGDMLVHTHTETHARAGALCS